MKKRKQKNSLLGIIIFIAFSLFTIIYQNTNTYVIKQDNLSNNKKVIENSINNSNIKEELIIHFIDVGQADSILIVQGNYSMLIDAGNDVNGEQIIKYVNAQGITKLDYVIGTHAHADHIGGLDKIINYYEIDKIYFPKQTATTKNYEDFILAVKNKNMKINVPFVGERFKLGNAICEILSPEQKEYEEQNNYSIVLKITYGDTSYLFMGDAEKKIENKLIEKNVDISADVLKVGHHGSNTSSGEKFLKKVNPKYAIISVGKDNDYNLPANKVIKRITNMGINILRTDKMGTIILVSDGKNIILNN